MKPVNIQSLLQARGSLDKGTFDSYLAWNGIAIKPGELNDLEELVKTAEGIGAKAQDLDSFYVGYKIPQIGKEFDLLRFSRDSILNVEFKSESTSEKIKSQLLRNKYYLSFLGQNSHAFTFVSTTGEVYCLGEDDELEASDVACILEVIRADAVSTGTAPDSLFNPSDYLVSPFNSTAKFLAGKYFLTQQQEEIRTEILDAIQVAPGASFSSITGSAGTGKTLLTFDIARHFRAKGKRVLVLHCGQLNEGHYALMKQGWKIAAIKNYKSHDISQFDVLVIDEAQRIFETQLDDIVTRATLAKCACIFSYDKVQTLSSWEEKNDLAGKIEALASKSMHKLSEKIRTNKEIASFIKLLFSKKAKNPPLVSGNIKISYFNTADAAKAYLTGLDGGEWEVLRFTPSQYNKEHHENYFAKWSKNSHEVIGQEFDGVAIALDQYFTYDDDGDLVYGGKAYYAPVKMLFQNITRARRRLNLVIVGNQEILSRCLAILK